MMNDWNKTKKELIKELTELRTRIAHHAKKSDIEHIKTEEALRESEKRYRTLFEKASIGIIITRNRKILLCNKKECEILGYQNPEELYARTIDQFIHPDDLPRMLNLAQQLYAGMELREPVTFRAYRKDDREIILEAFAIQFILNGESCVLSFQSDITERKQVEKSLKESEQKFRFITESLSDIVWQVDMNTRFVSISPSVERIIGYTVSEMLNFTGKDIFTPESLAKARDKMQKLLNRAPGEAMMGPTEYRMIHKNGHIINVENSASVFRDSSGNPIGFFGITRDITHRKRVEEDLRKAKEFSESLIETANAIILTLDKDANITIFNHFAEQITGYKKEEVIGKNWFDVFIQAKDKPKIPEVFDQILRQMPEVSRYVNSIICKNDELRLIEWQNTILKNDKGEPNGVLSIGLDLTEKEKSAQDKTKLEKQLQQSQKMEAVGTLAGGVAHDFNNLLTAILGNVDLLLMDIPSSCPLREDLKEIQKAAKRSAALTRQLLAFSRRQPLQKKFINLNNLIKNIIKMLNRLIGEDIKLVTILDIHLENTYADPGQIEQVLLNLAVNARDAMPDGGQLTIRTENATREIVDSQKPSGPVKKAYVCIYIRDTGIGMPENMVKKIFEPFFSTKGPGRGTGLGLSVVYGIIKQHEGLIEVTSEPGKGTKFTISLPVVTSDVVAPDKAPTTMDSLKGNGERILIVEDQEEVLHLNSRVLSKNGYVVFKAKNANEALNIFKEENGQFDLILCDVVLPDMTGIDLVENLRAENGKLNILLCSGYTDHKAQWPLIQEKGYPFLQKPFTIIKLLTEIKKIISA
jgi:two-component system cell cycle sensor histidine kinase/response regulator CckA